MSKERVYIAGSMRGIPFYNFPAFDKTAKTLRLLGYEVVNPADMDRANGFDAMKLPADYDWNSIPEGFDFEDCVTRDIEAVRKCDAIFLLNGWETSKGALAEKALAEWLGKDIWYEDHYQKVDEIRARLMIPVSPKSAVPPNLVAPPVVFPPPDTAVIIGRAEPKEYPVFPEDSGERLGYPMFEGLLNYFPHACAEVARHSQLGNDQHNPGQPLHWAKEKSIGKGNQVVRHLMDGWYSVRQGARDTAIRHFAGMCWRALEMLERYITHMPPFDRGSK